MNDFGSLFFSIHSVVLFVYLFILMKNNDVESIKKGCKMLLCKMHVLILSICPSKNYPIINSVFIVYHEGLFLYE